MPPLSGLFFAVRQAALWLLAAFPLLAQGQSNPYDHCVILDRPPEVMWQMGGGYTFRAGNSAEGWDDVGVFEFHGIGGLAFVETRGGADFNLEVRADTRILQGFDGSTSGYPLNRLFLFAEYSQRLDRGWGFRLDLSPGLYSDLNDLSGDALAFPFGVSLVRAIHEELSFLIGVSVFPGFERVADPRIGLRWAPQSAGMRLDLLYPESLLSLDFTPGFGLHAGARFLPWLEYQLKDRDPRDRLRFQENRVYAGLHFAAGEYGRWSLDVGYMFEREIEFERAEPTVEIDDAPYVALTYTSLF